MVTCKWCEMGCKLVLIINRKWRMGFEVGDRIRGQLPMWDIYIGM